MSETKRPIEDLVAGHEFIQKMLPRADSHHHDAPLWYGWVIMDAFLAGMDHAKARTPSPDGVREALGTAIAIFDYLQIANIFRPRADTEAFKLIEECRSVLSASKPNIDEGTIKTTPRSLTPQEERLLFAALSKPAGDE